ncbi:hypothetical protein [Beggiatoa leptomitoformis]|uniref:Uncharacterized protein n=1 Tax=Beggiatoa leptomitoformis TaxID=288004 RepID=A0A2N9YAV9_9GAMM|nr:hypothetical protein [Beggiatoa leptomitoformis]ALG67042.1 hypothetical protein AL038_04060 [Beggiatoa leptomitoformis]AUI67579.1 hypothetical protein BLE401_01950 [Beggiatoa leptomitoformis]
MQWLCKFIFIFLYFSLLPIQIAIPLGLITFFWQSSTKSGVNEKPKTAPERRELFDLLTFYFELRSNHKQWRVTPAEYQDLLTKIEARCKSLVHYHYIDEIEKNRRLTDAWQLLRPQQTPCWEQQATLETESPQTNTQHIDDLIKELDNTLAPVTLPPAVTLPASVVIPKPRVNPVVIKQTVATVKPRIVKPLPSPKTTPTTPSLINRLQVFTRQILLPFIWQNIGWFVGGFCFVSGSGLLVAYTDGFANGLAVLFCLALYTLLILWGAYQIRRQRPELLISHQVLNFLGIFLIPLNFAAAVRLFMTSDGNFALLAVATLCAVGLWGGFLFALKIASGSLERQSLKEYPRLFLFLAGLQFALPLVSSMNSWYFLAVLHILLLAGLSYAFLRFTQGWLKALFLDADLLTYFTVGSLLYAALISFVHLTVSSGLTLPVGYAGGLLMLVCVLLFYVDSCANRDEFKQTIINYFTFLIYALSVTAIVLSYSSAWFIPTLSLAIGLYAAMVWRYLTLSPLYLLLAASVVWYWQVVLVHFTPDEHFLASVPLFVALWQLYRLACRRESPRFIVITYRTLLVLLFSVLAWSLYYAHPSVIGLITSLSASLLIFLLSKGRNTSPYMKTLGFIGAVTLNGIYFPLLPTLTVSVQFTLLFLLLSLIWTVISLSKWLKPAYAPVWFMQAGILSGLISIFISLNTHDILLSLAVTSGFASLLLSIGWIVRVRAFFYSGLLFITGVVVVSKLLFFPQTNLLALLLVTLVLWWVTWGLQRLQQRLLVHDIHLEPLLFLGMPLARTADRFTLLIPPCQISTIILWGVGIFGLLHYLLLPLSILSTGSLLLVLEAVITLLMAGQTRQLWLLPAVLFWLGLVLVPIFSDVQPLVFCFFLACYALGAWLTALIGLQFFHPRLTQLLCWQGGYGQRGGYTRAMQWVFYSTLFLLIGVQGASLSYALLFPHLGDGVLTAIFILSTLYFVILGRYYRYIALSYAALLTITISLLSFIGLPTLFALDLAQVLTILLGIAVALVGVTYPLRLSPVFSDLYYKPLYYTATLLYAYVLLHALSLLVWQFPMTSIWLAYVFGGLVVAQLPIFQWLAKDALHWRGIFLPLQLLAIVLVLFPQGNEFAWLILPFVLLGLAYYGLPWFNRLFALWAIDPTITFMLSFFVLFALPVVNFLQTGQIAWQIMLTVAAYFWLLQQQSHAENNRSLFTHLLFLALFGTFYSLSVTLFVLTAPSIFALWALLLFGLLQLGYRIKECEVWLFLTLIMAIISLFLLAVSLPQQLITFSIISGIALTIGGQQRDTTWFNVGILGGLVALHLLWFFLPATTLWAVLPYYALQNAVLLCVLLTLFPMLKATEDNWFNQLKLEWLIPFITASTLVLWAVGLVANLLVNQPLFGVVDSGILFLTGGIFIALWQAYRVEPTEKFIGIVFLITILAIYSRMSLFGFSSLTLWDSVALMLAAYGSLFSRYFIQLKVLDRLNLLLPCIALVPLLTVSDSTAITLLLFTGAVYYFFLQNQMKTVLPLYLAMILLNIALYLWIPALAQQQHLVQLYVLPAAITVLIMTYIHTQELRTTINHNLRLLALTVLYTSATTDVFLRPELSFFILALGLSMGGIILGIALRTRAFLYAGIVFLMINVLGQLVQFYPEDRLSKAIILILLGGGITVSMIFFNLKREMLLQKIRIMRADLAEWR